MKLVPLAAIFPFLFIAGISHAFPETSTGFNESSRHVVTISKVDRVGNVETSERSFAWIWNKEDPIPCAQVEFEENGHSASVCVRETSNVFPPPSLESETPPEFHYVIDLPYLNPVVLPGAGCETFSLESTLTGSFFIAAVQCSEKEVLVKTSLPDEIKITRLDESDPNRNRFKFLNKNGNNRGEIILTSPVVLPMASPSPSASPEPTPLEASPSPTPPSKRILSSIGLGLTSISYNEEGVAPYSSLALTAKGSVRYVLVPSKWDLGLSGYLTAIQLSKTPDVGVRFFGLNARAAYVLTPDTTPWRVSIAGGLYYLTMMVEGNAFGFKNLGGPQIYPEARWTFENGNALSLYAKYSPVANNFSLTSLSNREIATGIAFIHPLENGHSVSATFDYSNVELDINDVTISSHTLTFGIGYGF